MCACLCMCVLGRVCACVLVCLRVCSGVCTSVHAHVCRGQRRMSGALLSNSAPGPHETGSLTKPGTGVRPASSRVTLPSQPSAPKCRFWPHPDFLFYSGNFIHVYNEMSSCPSPLPSIHFPVLSPPPPVTCLPPNLIPLSPSSFSCPFVHGYGAEHWSGQPTVGYTLKEWFIHGSHRCQWLPS